MSSKANYMSEMLSLEEIISRSNKKHGNKYDYSKTKKSFGRNTIMKITPKENKNVTPIYLTDFIDSYRLISNISTLRLN